ncbi:MAG TPA: ROK family protein, partial [Myxococcota bacterium]|nr:ROK family protein [Myxococcota bacterium]
MIETNSQQKNPLLAFDLGGTKLEVGVVSQNGEILSAHRELLQLELGKDYVIETMVDWGKKYLEQYPEINAIGISSCGPLDPKKGLLLDATNLLTNGKGWGVVPLREIIATRLKKTTFFDNDAACSVLAERYLGAGRHDNCENLMVLTLGTGLGTGIICNG